jgi:hypothetical protein
MTGEPTLTPPVATPSGVRMAQRTLRRLLDARQVLSSKAPDGSIIYALAEAGARRLRQIGVDAFSGKDLMRSFSSAYFRHRVIANEIAIGSIIAGARCSVEREIAQGRWLGGADGIAGKKPDVLVRADKRVFWIEVERSSRSKVDHAKLLAFLHAVAADVARPDGSRLLRDGLRWAKVIFICRPAFEVRLRRDLQAAGWKKNLLDELVRFETTLYGFKDINFD